MNMKIKMETDGDIARLVQKAMEAGYGNDPAETMAVLKFLKMAEEIPMQTLIKCNLTLLAVCFSASAAAGVPTTRLEFCDIIARSLNQVIDMIPSGACQVRPVNKGDRP